MDINYHQIKPSQALSDYVKFFWIGKVTASKEDHFRHLSIATRSPQLIFHYQGTFTEVTATGTLKESFSSGIQGPSKTHAEFISCENVGIFGIEFFPYAIPALFSISAAAITNQYIDLKTFLGAKGSDLEDRIFSADTNRERVRIATEFLESQIKRTINPHIIAAVKSIDESGGQMDLKTLLKNVPFSQKQLERLFSQHVGFTPKLYLRITRFETAINNLHKKRSFTSLALDTGYFDQSHFNHDFMEFTGLQPKNYLKAIGNLPVDPQC
jgi:AraC-like DNA-binding protein